MRRRVRPHGVQQQRAVTTKAVDGHRVGADAGRLFGLVRGPLAPADRAATVEDQPPEREKALASRTTITDAGPCLRAG